ncbi:hypothetical protein V8G54_007717 [Vigna mungo]|uniref:Uncharacterized protein n=1 Tax=Vigna mungo TaxID=3915 RepID=A0AAQ3P3U4_VIGMU
MAHLTENPLRSHIPQRSHTHNTPLISPAHRFTHVPKRPRPPHPIIIPITTFPSILPTTVLIRRRPEIVPSAKPIISTTAAANTTTTGTGGGALSIKQHQLKPLIEIHGIGPHKSGVIPGAGVSLVSKISHIEEPCSSAGGVKDLLLEQRGTLVHEPVYEHERLERHNPVPRLPQTLRHRGDACVDVAPRVRHEVQDLPDVLLAGGVVVVAGGLDNRDFHLRRHVAGDLRNPYAGLVLHHPNRLPDRRGSHRKPQPYSLTH